MAPSVFIINSFKFKHQPSISIKHSNPKFSTTPKQRETMILLLFLIQEILGNAIRIVNTDFKTYDPFCESNIIFPDATSDSCSGRAFQHGKSCTAQCLETVRLTCSCLNIHYGLIHIAKPDGCEWEIEGVCEIAVVKKTASADFAISLPPNTIESECAETIKESLESSSSNVAAEVTCSSSSSRKRRSLNEPGVQVFNVEARLTITETVTDNNTTSSNVTDVDNDGTGNIGNLDTEAQLTSIFQNAVEQISEAVANETGLELPTIEITVSNVTVEETRESAETSEEEIDLAILESPFFTPQICNSTLEEDTYRVEYERSMYLNVDAASTAEILAAFPADLIANHILCVEFTDVFDQLYITVDSKQITDEFFEVYSTIEEQVENTIDDVISNLVSAGTVTLPTVNRTSVSFAPQEQSPLMFNIEISMDFETDWTWNPQFSDRSTTSYDILSKVVSDIFEASWNECAELYELVVSSKILFSKQKTERRRRAASDLTSVAIIMDFIPDANNTILDTPSELVNLEVEFMAELSTALYNASASNDLTNILPQLFLPTFICETSVHFESYEEPVTSTVIPTTSTAASFNEERFAEIESSITNLADEMTGLENDVSEIESRFDKKTKQDKMMEMMMLQSLFRKAPSTGSSKEVEERLRQNEADTDAKLDNMESRLLDIINAVAFQISSLKTDIFSAFGLE